VGQYWAEAARYMSDSLLLPFSVTSYASSLRSLVGKLDVGYGSLMRQNGLSLGEEFTIITLQRLSLSISQSGLDSLVIVMY